MTRPTLHAIEAWKPPKGATVQMVVCVNLGTRILFHSIRPHQSAIETINQLDRLAHCLLVTDEPDLPDEWVNELETTWNHFEKEIDNVPG